MTVLVLGDDNIDNMRRNVKEVLFVARSSVALLTIMVDIVFRLDVEDCFHRM